MMRIMWISLILLTGIHAQAPLDSTFTVQQLSAEIDSLIPGEFDKSHQIQMFEILRPVFIQSGMGQPNQFQMYRDGFRENDPWTGSFDFRRFQRMNVRRAERTAFSLSTQGSRFQVPRPVTQLYLMDADYQHTNLNVLYENRISERLGLRLNVTNLESLGAAPGGQVTLPIVDAGFMVRLSPSQALIADIHYSVLQENDYGFIENGDFIDGRVDFRQGKQQIRRSQRVHFHTGKTRYQIGFDERETRFDLSDSVRAIAAYSSRLESAWQPTDSVRIGLRYERLQFRGASTVTWQPLFKASFNIGKAHIGLQSETIRIHEDDVTTGYQRLHTMIDLSPRFQISSDAAWVPMAPIIGQTLAAVNGGEPLSDQPYIRGFMGSEIDPALRFQVGFAWHWSKDSYLTGRYDEVINDAVFQSDTRQMVNQSTRQIWLDAGWRVPIVDALSVNIQASGRPLSVSAITPQYVLRMDFESTFQVRTYTHVSLRLRAEVLGERPDLYYHPVLQQWIISDLENRPAVGRLGFDSSVKIRNLDILLSVRNLLQQRYRYVNGYETDIYGIYFGFNWSFID